MSKLSPKLHEEDILSSLEMSSVQAGEMVKCQCSCHNLENEPMMMTNYQNASQYDIRVFGGVGFKTLFASQQAMLK